MEPRVGLILGAAYCALILVFGGGPESGQVRSQESCPVPDPLVTLDAKWMVERVCPCASLPPGEACDCEKRKYIATIVSALETQHPHPPEVTATLDLVGAIRQATPLPTDDPTVTSVPTAVPTEHPHPSATPSAQPVWRLYAPRTVRRHK